MNAIKTLLGHFGRGLRTTFIALGAVATMGGLIAIADYAVTQGTGTNFASKIISTVHYAAQLICDATAGETQCAAVDSSGRVSVNATQVTSPWITAGNVSNASDGVATSSINVPAIGYMYVWNGTTWDRFQPNRNGAASIANSAPVTAATINVTPTDCSISLTTGGTAQNIIAASATLHGFTISNIDPSTGSGEPVWISFTGTAAASTAGSYPLAAPTATTFANLSSYTTPLGFGVNHAISVVAATTGHKISCTQW